jgi:hypothetical protein
MNTANNLLPPKLRQAVHLGTVFEIGVRFPATTHHPVLSSFIICLSTKI